MLGWHFAMMRRRRGGYGSEDRVQLHTIIFLPYDLPVPGGDTFFLDRQPISNKCLLVKEMIGDSLVDLFLLTCLSGVCALLCVCLDETVKDGERRRRESVLTGQWSLSSSPEANVLRFSIRDNKMALDLYLLQGKDTLPCSSQGTQRDACGARPGAHPSRLKRRLLSSSSPPVLWGEMLPLVYVTLSVPRLTNTLVSPVLREEVPTQHLAGLNCRPSTVL
ncbi:hypothetical protein NQZ68_000454 [Dissostichus eleginoides]|nr:hypothetical protein NQZ68_000454 [Dissostichus eleginoides]